MLRAEVQTSSVAVNPGHSAFTVTPVSRTSAASERVNPTSACLEAEYAATYGAPARPATEATLITRPQARSSMPGITARMRRNGPVTFVRRCRSHISRSVRLSGADSAIPALFTRTSIGPSVALTAATASVTASASPTSRMTAIVCPPLARSARATSSTSVRVRAATATAKPAWTNAPAISRPMPRPPPVTNATCLMGSRRRTGRGAGADRRFRWSGTGAAPPRSTTMDRPQRTPRPTA